MAPLPPVTGPATTGAAAEGTTRTTGTARAEVAVTTPSTAGIAAVTASAVRLRTGRAIAVRLRTAFIAGAFQLPRGMCPELDHRTGSQPLIALVQLMSTLVQLRF